ncbi:hypothetical protein NQ314_003703 [Rhamnusium bicolor]|uniref:Ribosomal RNA-processing protein 7 C-terminal domain-containing protein n=1 Tax=Rhamnusium bicolor TaxID=1586634 RepID=A0AAV8ZLK9_9CUCU|nr:hypothetical protein NQ314_003703 [Rhamnusium bicolor]
MNKMLSGNNQIFKVMPLRFSHSSTSYHNLFVKEHSVRHIDENKPPGKTLFVLNIPSYATENSLKVSFSIAGNVKSVIFEHENSENHISLLKLMKLEALNPLSLDDAPLKIGLMSWIEEYNSTIHNPKELQNRINIFMANYDKTEEKKKDKDTVDDEGWTVVTKKGRRPGIGRKESVENKLNNKTAQNKKELKNFYTYQIRESKIKNIATLRKNFEEAKNKVNLMKKARRFKPF